MADGDFTRLIVTYVCILTCERSTVSSLPASLHLQRSSTTTTTLVIAIQSFGITLDRQSFSAQDLSMSQLLRTV